MRCGGRSTGPFADEGRSDGFFRTLANLVSDALDHEAPLSLPTSEQPIVAAAMAYTKRHLDAVTAADVSRAVSVSERTLRRLFTDSIGLPWRTYLLHARMLRAMALLAAPGQSVQETASAVGFVSLSSFTRCLHPVRRRDANHLSQKSCRRTGLMPRFSPYRRRVGEQTFTQQRRDGILPSQKAFGCGERHPGPAVRCDCGG